MRATVAGGELVHNCYLSIITAVVAEEEFYWRADLSKHTLDGVCNVTDLVSVVKEQAVLFHNLVFTMRSMRSVV